MTDKPMAFDGCDQMPPADAAEIIGALANGSPMPLTT